MNETRGTYDTFEEAYRAIAVELTNRPEFECAPRGMPVKEVLASQITIKNPRTRALTSPARKFNAGFAAGEFCWYIRGASDVESLSYYNRRTPQFSDDGITIPGAYGPRIFSTRGWSTTDGTLEAKSQWELVVDELIRDGDSRRALVAVYSAQDASRAARGTRDVPCTVSIQLLLRDGHLNAIATMRSCDAVWGLANDVFSFTMMQEMAAVELSERGLDVKLGRYVHQAGSLHVYERHFSMLDEVSRERCPAAEMPPLERRRDLDNLLEDEVALRTGRQPSSARYGGAAAWLRSALEAHRARRDAEPAQSST